MTQNQISFQNFQETKRHNLATEGLTGKELSIKEDSNTINREHYERSDKAALTTAAANARNAESNAQNALTNARNADTQQYSAMTDRLNYEVNRQNAATNARNAATNERNAESNAINAEANRQNARTNYANYTVGYENMLTNRQNAESNQRQAAASESQATTAFLNYGLYSQTQPLNAEASMIRSQAAADRVDAQNFSDYGRGISSYANAVETAYDIGMDAIDRFSPFQNQQDTVTSFPGSATYYLLGN